MLLKSTNCHSILLALELNFSKLFSTYFSGAQNVCQSMNIGYLTQKYCGRILSTMDANTVNDKICGKSAQICKKCVSPPIILLNEAKNQVLDQQCFFTYLLWLFHLDCTSPFAVDIFTDALSDSADIVANALPSRGNI